MDFFIFFYYLLHACMNLCFVSPVLLKALVGLPFLLSEFQVYI